MSLQSVGDISQNVFEFEWKIKISDFTSIENGQYLSSANIITHSFGKEIKWCIDLSPKGRTKDCENFVSIFLRNLNSFELWCEFCFFFLSNNGAKVKLWKTSKQLFSQLNFRSWGGYKFVEHCFVIDPNNDLIKDDERCSDNYSQHFESRTKKFYQRE